VIVQFVRDIRQLLHRTAVDLCNTLRLAFGAQVRVGVDLGYLLSSLFRDGLRTLDLVAVLVDQRIRAARLLQDDGRFIAVARVDAVIQWGFVMVEDLGQAIARLRCFRLRLFRCATASQEIQDSIRGWGSHVCSLNGWMLPGC
jgi:hypothetical protein